MLIYVPKGRAREYSPLALNLYRGCEHRCSYCYCPRIDRQWSGTSPGRCVHWRVTLPD